MSEEKADVDLITRLKKQPKLFARMEELLGVVENAAGDIRKASEAETRVIEEVRRMGQEALSSWAAGRVEQVSIDAAKRKGVRSAGKKTLLAKRVRGH